MKGEITLTNRDNSLTIQGNYRTGDAYQSENDNGHHNAFVTTHAVAQISNGNIAINEYEWIGSFNRWYKEDIFLIEDK